MIEIVSDKANDEIIDAALHELKEENKMINGVLGRVMDRFMVRYGEGTTKTAVTFVLALLSLQMNGFLTKTTDIKEAELRHILEKMETEDYGMLRYIQVKSKLNFEDALR